MCSTRMPASRRAARTRQPQRARNGELAIFDGPFAEIKEMLAGFYLVDAKDLNDAIRLAAGIPPAQYASVDVRPRPCKNKKVIDVKGNFLVTSINSASNFFGYCAPIAIKKRPYASITTETTAGASATIRFGIPKIRITRFKLYASTCKLISVLTLGNVFVKKCVAPIQALSVPKVCSTVCLRTRMASGVRSRRSCIFSRIPSCSQRAMRRYSPSTRLFKCQRHWIAFCLWNDGEINW
jgi:YCII-related domain